MPPGPSVSTTSAVRIAVARSSVHTAPGVARPSGQHCTRSSRRTRAASLPGPGDVPVRSHEQEAQGAEVRARAPERVQVRQDLARVVLVGHGVHHGEHAGVGQALDHGEVVVADDEDVRPRGQVAGDVGQGSGLSSVVSGKTIGWRPIAAAPRSKVTRVRRLVAGKNITAEPSVVGPGRRGRRPRGRRPRDVVHRPVVEPGEGAHPTSVGNGRVGAGRCCRSGSPSAVSTGRGDHSDHRSVGRRGPRASPPTGPRDVPHGVVADEEARRRGKPSSSASTWKARARRASGHRCAPRCTPRRKAVSRPVTAASRTAGRWCRSSGGRDGAPGSGAPRGAAGRPEDPPGGSVGAEVLLEHDVDPRSSGAARSRAGAGRSGAVRAAAPGSRSRRSASARTACPPRPTRRRGRTG